VNSWWRVVAIDRVDNDDAPLGGRLDARDRFGPEAVERRSACVEPAEERDRASYGEQIRAYDRRLDADAEVDRSCEQIREIEEKILTPAMRRIETADPSRHLVGLDCRLKGEDRLKEKVAENLWYEPRESIAQVLHSIADAVRFTFVYPVDTYAHGARADISRLKDEGFIGVPPFKNSWEGDLYRGVNTRWREPSTGQAKQSTHGLYERQRTLAPTDPERDELADQQRRVFSRVPVPPGATEVRDFEGGRDG
jgi:hypothetical protein